MVNIKLSNTHALVNDVNCWVIVENSRPKWFYTSLFSALKDWYFNEAPKHSKAKDEPELLNYLKNSEKRLLQSLNTIENRGRRLKNE